MPERVTDLIQNIKTSCDPDTLLFHFKGTSRAEAFNRQALHEPWPSFNEEGTEVSSDDDTYYQRLIMPRITNEMALNILYKNLNGIWVDYHKCVLNYPRIAIQVSAVTYEEYVNVDIKDVPPCIYMDSSHVVHYIDEHDGTYPDYRIPIIDIDESEEGKVSYSPFSLEEPNLPFSARHVMTDLKVKVKDIPSDSLLVWLNGIFVPIIRDETYEDVFYIKNAMTAIGSKCINQKLNAPWNYEDKNATVKEDEEFNEYRMDARFRFFSWKNVKASMWYAPLSIEKVPIIHNYSSIYIIKKIVFPEAINKNAHMILDNGIILDPEEYTIDPYDPRKITLKYVETSAYRLLNEIIKDINENIDVYVGMRPLSLIETVLVNKTYSLINFSSEEETEEKKLYLKRSIACATDFPYKNEITFPDIALGDLVIVNGTFNEYEWVHNHTIGYPLFRYTYNGNEAQIHENDVKRLYFICK
jgi:hypothetical protein